MCAVRPSTFRSILRSLIQATIISCVLAVSPQPLSVTFSDRFVGYDGQWSAAQIRVGTPEQWLSLLPSTLSSETWVVGSGGCNPSLTCFSKRGGIFWQNQSSTWDELGYYDLTYFPSVTLPGQYGLDSVAISDDVSAQNQSIAVVNTTSIWIGNFGLGVGTNRYGNNVDYSSFLTTLVQNLSLIPSHSYGYTAGAYYASKSVPGSLTLGGVDTTRYAPNEVNFTLSSGYKPVVAVTAITVNSASTSSVALPSNWNQNPLTLMAATDAHLFTIDTSTPFLWMPQAVCDSFATALNLTYDPNLNLYVFGNSSTSQTLDSWDLTFTFTLANEPSSPATIELPISYNAFNLQLTYPFPGLLNATANSQPVNYFPLRRANQTSQYTIGRAFLQETYLTVDYERNTFWMAPAVLPDVNTVQPRLVAITRPADSKFPGPKSASAGLSTGAKAGIGVSVALVVVGIFATLIFWLIRRKRRSKDMNEKSKGRTRRSVFNVFGRKQNSKQLASELPADKHQPTEVGADKSNTRYELAGNAPVEMPAAEVPSAYYETNQALERDRSDPSRPAELEQTQNQRRNSISKELITDSTMEIPMRSSSPAPPYSPTGTGTNTGIVANASNGTSDTRNISSISPNSTNLTHRFGGSQSSGSQGISPVAGSFSSRQLGLRLNSNTPSDLPASGIGAQFQSQSSTSQTNSHSSAPSNINIDTTRGSGGGTTSNDNDHNAESTSTSQPQRASVSGQAPPNRTTSRNSRFREDFELVDEPLNGPNNVSRTMRTSTPTLRERFSWELD